LSASRGAARITLPLSEGGRLADFGVARVHVIVQWRTSEVV
jgi:hypothetical protein